MFSLGNLPWKLWKSYVNENRSRRLGDAMTVTFWAMQNDFGKAGPLKQFDSCSRGEIMGQGSKFLVKEMKENYKHHTWSSLWENLPNTLFCLHQFEDWKPSAFRKKIAKKEECMGKKSYGWNAQNWGEQQGKLQKHDILRYYSQNHHNAQVSRKN